MAERRRHLSVLGLQDGASEDDIRKAYKKLALQYHPDKNDSDDAKEKFQELSCAYKNLTEGPGEFDGVHAHDIRAEFFFRRMFEEMFFPSFLFRGPRGFPSFVFVDSDEDECYYFSDSSDDDDYMFNSHGSGYRHFQNRYPGPSHTGPTQHEPSKKQQRKREKRQRQRDRAKEKKAQENNEKPKQWQPQDYFKNNTPDKKISSPKSNESNQRANQSKENKKPAENQSEQKQTTNEPAENQSKVNNQSKKPPETGRSETPNLSRPATPQETQQMPQKLTKKQRKKMESEQRKREQEMAEIAAELLRKQEREKEKQKEKEKKAEQKNSEEKENDENLGWPAFDTKKKSRKARQRARRRQEAAPTASVKNDSSSSESDDDDDDGNSNSSDGKEATMGNSSSGEQREPLKNVQPQNQSNLKSFTNPHAGNIQNMTNNAATSVGSKNGGRVFTNSTTRSAGPQHSKVNGYMGKNQKQKGTGDSGFNVFGPSLSNKYNVLDGFDDAILKDKVDSSGDSDSEVEGINMQKFTSLHEPRPRSHNAQGHTDMNAKGSYSNRNQAKGNPQNTNSAGPTHNTFSERRQNEGSRGGGIQNRGGYSGRSTNQSRGGYSSRPTSASESGRFRERSHGEYNHFNGFPNRNSPDFHEPNIDFRGRHETPFYPQFNDYGPPMNGPGPQNFRPPQYQSGPGFPPHFNRPPPRSYGPSGGFEPPFPPAGDSFPSQRGLFNGRPPGFQTGPPRSGIRGKGGRPYVDPHQKQRENANSFHGNKPANAFQTIPKTNVSPSPTGDFVDGNIGVYSSNGERKSPLIGANSPALGGSSNSGGSLDSLDEFSSSQGCRPKYGDNFSQTNKDGRTSPCFGGLVGLDALGVPKGILGDHVKNYYS